MVVAASKAGERMLLTPDQQLELYTSVQIPHWISELPEYKSDCLGFLFRYRGNWTFTSEQLRQHLNQHPEFIEDYLQHCQNMIGIHEKVVIARDGRDFVVFDQDHGRKVGIERFRDKVDAAISWLEYRFLN